MVGAKRNECDLQGSTQPVNQKKFLIELSKNVTWPGATPKGTLL